VEPRNARCGPKDQRFRAVGLDQNSLGVRDHFWYTSIRSRKFQGDHRALF
jgi:hypothetical protein